MASGLQRVRITAPDGGIDGDSSPNVAAPNKGLVLQNYLTGEKGRIRQRGPLISAGVSYGITDKRIVGAIPGNDRLLVGFRDALQGTNVIEPWVAPRTLAADDTANVSLAKGHYADNTGMKKLNLLAGGSKTDVDMTADTGMRNRVPSWAWTRMGNFVLYVGYDSDNDVGNNQAGFSVGKNDRGGAQRLTRLIEWNITNTSDQVTSITRQITYGPYGMQDIRLHYNRLFALGGRHPNTIGPYINNNCLWYTRALVANHHDYGFSPNNYWPASVPDDSDNNSGAGVSPDAAWNAGVDSSVTRSPAWGEALNPGVYNRIDLPWEEDFGVCFANVGRNLGIFKRHYLLLLQGFGVLNFDGITTDFALRTAITGVGAIDPRSVVEANEGVYFLSHHGFMFFDGVRVHDVSVGMKRTLLKAGLQACGDDGEYAFNGGFAVASKLERDYIMLTIGYAPFHATTVPDPTITFCGIYHIPSNSWSTFSSASLNGNGPTWLGRTESKFALLDKTNFFASNRLSVPEQAAEADRGKDGSNVISTKWHSKVVELAAPFERAQLHRVIVDYEWIVDTGTAEQYVGPTVTLCDGSGNALDAADTGAQGTVFTLPSGADAGNEVLRSRHVQDVFANCSEVMVKVEYTGTARALVESAIHDIWIEYSIAHERHTTS